MSRKRREIAIIVPIFGVLVFSAPILDAFGLSSQNLVVQYVTIIALWFLLILAAFVLNRVLRKELGGD